MNLQDKDQLKPITIIYYSIIPYSYMIDVIRHSGTISSEAQKKVKIVQKLLRRISSWPIFAAIGVVKKG